MTDTLRLAIFGAGGKAGRQAVRQAHARGHHVRAIEPSWPQTDDLPDAVERRTADVMQDDLAPVIDGCDAILSCIGLPLTIRTALNPPPLYTQSADAYVDAMKRTGIDRIAVISASFVVTRDRGPLVFRAAATAALEPIFTQMGEMERILRASGTGWTAVRPGWLMAGEPTDDAQIRADVIAEDTIRTRHGDLARLMLDCVERSDWLHRTPAISRRESARDESAAALLREIAP